MPIYVYQPKEACEHCQGEFEVIQSIKEEPLKRCPTCGKECERVFGSFSMGKGKLGFDVTKAKQSGMKVLKRRDKGVYEAL